MSAAVTPPAPGTPRRGRFITFEGIDGAGKSTHVGWCVERLRAHGLEVETTREPGGTPLSERIRELLLSEPMDRRSETLLMFAARREHVVARVEPALRAGRWVVSDRFGDSTWAYQGGGRGESPGVIATLESMTHPGLQPDRTFWFDVPPEEAARRRAAARAADRFEAEDVAFFERVRDGYRARAAQEPDRIVRIDALQTVTDVQKQLEEVIEKLVKSTGCD